MKYFILLIGFLFSCFGKVDNEKKQKEKNIQSDYTLINIFKDDSEQIIGKAYARYFNKVVFDTLYILSASNDTLYSIERDDFQNREGKDIDIFSKNFYGYKTVLAKRNYIVLTFLSDNGKSVSDDITIEWVSDKEIFEVLRTP